jgi:uncharacterized protein (TIGR04255 family)
MSDLPQEINPCPIKEAVFELRFKTDFPGDAVFGIVFNKFKNEFNNTASQLPVMEIPTIVRNQDPNLKFAPHYKMEEDFFNMLIGPNVISLVNIKEYVGWKLYKNKIIDVFSGLQDIELIKHIDRLGLRYINIFPNLNIFDKSSITISLDNAPLTSPAINLSTQLINNNVTSTTRIISGAQAKISNEVISGSIVDIDSSVNDASPDNFSDLLDKVHDEEKKLFFKIIGQDHLETLNPKYERSKK